GPPTALWKTLFPRAERAVVCPAEPRRLLLQAACLAGAVRAPLYVLHGESGEEEGLQRQLADWWAREILAVGAAAKVCRDLPDVKLVPLADEKAVADACLSAQRKQGPVQTLVVANPSDGRRQLGGMSALAPLVALQRRAALLLTNDKGDDTAALVRAALKDP